MNTLKQSNSPEGQGQARPTGRLSLAVLFAAVGGLIGFVLGTVEGVLLFTIPRASGLLKPDTHYVVLFLAPLADMPCFAALGFLLGLPTAIGRRNSPLLTRVLAAIGIGIAGTYLAFLLGWFRVGAGVIFPVRFELRTFVAAFLLTAAIALLALWLGRDSDRSVAETATGHAAGAMLRLTAVLAAGCFAGVLFYSAFRPLPSSPTSAAPVGQGRPNIVLIVMDTVRADHLSCYGYHRPTTPFLQRLAARGTLFEDAIAPTSWTLPALASIFTGLLPHQNGADWTTAMSQQPWTLARLLRAMGYETAGFSANPYYGLGAWGLDNGFDEYVDDSYSIRHNLAVTFAGQTIWQFLYSRLVRFNQFNHRGAGDLNQDILHWYRNRSDRPYFLFINYMDAHRPYLPPAPYDHRFGRLSRTILARISGPLRDGRPAVPFSATQNQQLIDGYDNSLAYLDARMSKLIRTLTQSPGGDDTIVIVTADHGEGFDDHGTYDHGYNLYREVLQVPLIIEGPGIPAGRRIPDLVGTRQLFATVLDLATGGKLPLGNSSLERFWKTSPNPASERVVSELQVRGRPPGSAAEMSLVTPDWHLIVGSGGETCLFEWQKDRDERANETSAPVESELQNSLRESLRAAVARSTFPWLNLNYLKPLNLPGETFIQQIAARKSPWPVAGSPIGSVQSLFTHATVEKPAKPSQEQQDNLRSLPY
jgi:arylsulfatase A-like enzyme